MTTVAELLQKVLLCIDSGSRPKGGAQSGNGDIPSIGAEHLDSDGGFKFYNSKYIPQAFYSSLRKGHIQKNDILIVKDGATTGKKSFIDGQFPFPDAAINEPIFRLTPNPEIVEPAYLFRHLSSPYGNRQIMLDFRGATVGGISRAITEIVQIPPPPRRAEGLQGY